MSNQIKYGADPEAFATYEKDGMSFVLPPAWFRVYDGATVVVEEDKPTHPIFWSNEKFGAIGHEDGAAFEFGIKPAGTFMELWSNLQIVVREFNEYMGSKHSAFTGLKFLPTVNYEVDRWLHESEEFVNCLRFGCDPDQDAFDMEKAAHVIDASLHTERYGGGHCHFSGHPLFAEAPVLSIKIFAATVGLAAVGYSDTPELDRSRTCLYGLPGKFRIQNYKNGDTGVEYRTPSNRWVTNLEMAEAMSEAAGYAINVMANEPAQSAKLISELTPIITRSIIKADQKSCLKTLDLIYKGI